MANRIMPTPEPPLDFLLLPDVAQGFADAVNSYNAAMLSLKTEDPRRFKHIQEETQHLHSHVRVEIQPLIQCNFSKIPVAQFTRPNRSLEMEIIGYNAVIVFGKLLPNRNCFVPKAHRDVPQQLFLSSEFAATIRIIDTKRTIGCSWNLNLDTLNIVELVFIDMRGKAEYSLNPLAPPSVVSVGIASGLRSVEFVPKNINADVG